MSAPWLIGDEVYGQDPRLRTALEQRRMGYVLAIAGNRRVELEGVQVSAAEVAARVADRHWHRYRAGQEPKGPRWYAWAWARIDEGDEGEAQGCRWLLIRRNLTTGELAFYRCYAPTRQPLMALVKIAGARWAVEGVLPGCQGPGRPGPLPDARLDGLAPSHDPGSARPGRADGHRRRQPPSTADDRIPLTLPEIRRLLAALVLTRHRSVTDLLRWSDWRRRHQATARHCHYQRRSEP